MGRGTWCSLPHCRLPETVIYWCVPYKLVHSQWYLANGPIGEGDSKTSRRKRHNPEQIVRKLQQADCLLNVGETLAHVFQALEVSAATYHRWRNQYGGMKCEEAKRLKELETENSRLKRLLAEAELDKAMLKEIASGNFWARRAAAKSQCSFKILAKCRNVGLDRMPSRETCQSVMKRLNEKEIYWKA